MSEEELITTTEAAKLLGVGPSTVKRWADDNVLACVRTAGGHRRFLAEEVSRFKQQGLASGNNQDVGRWLEVLLAPDADPFQVNAALMQARGERGSWWEVCESLIPVLQEIGVRWTRGELAISEEHVASERFARGLAFVTQSVQVSPRSPACVLVTAEGDDHTLGLSMVEVVAREAGWSTVWLGRNTPHSEVLDAVERRRARAVAVSASSFSSDQTELGNQASTLGKVLHPRGIPLLLGGSGNWPEEPEYGERLFSFQQFAQRLTEIKEGYRLRQ